MRNRSPSSLAGEIATSALGAILVGVGSWFVSQSWAFVACAVTVGLVLSGVLATVIRRGHESALAEMRRSHDAALAKSVKFGAPLTTLEAKERIRSAKREIWSFQISGSEFTAHSIETYQEWLAEDRNRRLTIAFANPANTPLLKNIVKLDGLSKLSDDDDAYQHLRAQVKRGLNNYVYLGQEFPSQVDVRVYDFGPPFSVHAVDPKSDDDGSLCIELYIPDLAYSERPCMMLRSEHPMFRRYHAGTEAWLSAAIPPEAHRDSPDI